MSLTGQHIGCYRVVRLLGSGGMGDVYLAEDPRIEQQVAIKVIRAGGSSYPDDSSTKDATRIFEREAKAIARLDHPYILSLYDYGEESFGGTTLIYLVMPYRPEGSLASWLDQHFKNKLLSLHDITHIVRQAADALQHAHNRQIIHQGPPGPVMYQHFKVQPTLPSALNRRLSGEIDTVLLHALTKDPTKRFASVTAFGNAFQQAVQATLSADAPTIIIQNRLVNSGGGEITSTEQTTKGNSMPPGATRQNTVAVISGDPVIQGRNETKTFPLATERRLLPHGKVVDHHRRTRRRLWLAVTLALLALMLIIGSITFAAPGAFVALIGNIFGKSASVSNLATVTITPQSTDLVNTYRIMAVTGMPDATRLQVQARLISTATPSQSKTVNASGTKSIPAVRAQGTLEILSNAAGQVGYPAGTVLTATNGVQVVLDQNLFTSNYGNSGITTSPAHALLPGSSGNIPIDALYVANGVMKAEV